MSGADVDSRPATKNTGDHGWPERGARTHGERTSKLPGSVHQRGYHHLGQAGARSARPRAGRWSHRLARRAHLTRGGPEVVEAAEDEEDRGVDEPEDRHGEQDRPVPCTSIEFSNLSALNIIL